MNLYRRLSILNPCRHETMKLVVVVVNEPSSRQDMFMMPHAPKLAATVPPPPYTLNPKP